MAKQIAEVKSINSFINKFLMENLDSEDHGVLMEAWNSEGIQKELQKLLPTSEKKIKDPNAPKRGKSSYLFFCEDHRAAAKERLEEAGGDYKATDVTKMLGTMWTELKDDAKRKKEFANYEKKSKEDKERYEREIASYVPPSQEEMEAMKKTKVKKVKDPDAPKKGKSAYLFFCEEERPKVKEDLGDEVKSSEITTELGVRWTDLNQDSSSDATKRIKKYVELAKQDKERYERERAEYSPPTEEELKDKKKTKEKKVVKKTPPRKVSAYALFSKEERVKIKEDNPTMSSGDVTKALSTRWQEMSDEEKEEWRAKASSD